MPAQLSADGQRVQLALLDARDDGGGRFLATSEFHLFGATCTSWRIVSDEDQDRLFLSQRAVLDPPPVTAAADTPAPRKAIRGGIPLVFPQFGTGPRSPRVQHGFARVHRWRWLGIERERAGEEVVAAFALTHEDLRAQSPAGEGSGDQHAWADCWPHRFKLVYRVQLTPRALRTELVVRNDNAGHVPFHFTALLHTYFRVHGGGDGVRQGLDGMRVRGLGGCRYQDKLMAGAVGEQLEQCDALRIQSEVDRVYLDVKGPVVVDQPGGLSTRMDMLGGLRDVVLWNPWVDKAKAMADFGDDEYLNMVCVEAGAVAKEVELRPGEEWMGGQLLTALPNQ